MQIAEYGDVKFEQFGKKYVLAQQENRGRTYQLVHRSAGYQCAGSAARFDNEAIGVLFEADGATHGRWFKMVDEAKARKLFNALSTQQPL